MHPYKNLGLAGDIVKENVVIVKRKEIKLWKQRGFRTIFYYPIFHYVPSLMRVIMLGKPKTIKEFQLEHICGAEIMDMSICDGSYGMGGPGFFALCIKKDGITYRLTYCIWNASERVLLDSKVLTCHSNVEKWYHPWLGSGAAYVAGMKRINKFMAGTVVESVDLQEHAIAITFKDIEGNTHTFASMQQSNAFPPKGGSGKKTPCYKDGCMADYWLVTYDSSILMV